MSICVKFSKLNTSIKEFPAANPRIRKNPLIFVLDKFTRGNNKKFKNENIKTVIDGIIYRGSSVPVGKFQILAENNIKKILDLRTISKKEAKKLSEEAEKYGMKYENIPLDPFRIKKAIKRIIKIIEDSSEEEPLYIHCTFGIDRTSFVSALAHHIKEGLSIPQAIKDMRDHGFRGIRRLILLNMERYLKKMENKSKTPLLA